jgi:hypothetical protein
MNADVAALLADLRAQVGERRPSAPMPIRQPPDEKAAEDRKDRRNGETE